jgi:putative transposase
MPRIARITVSGMPHHVTQRGNYRQRVFEKEKDFQEYVKLINECSDKFGLDILAYCLMNNHVHFVVIPRDKESLAKTFNTTHMRYAQYVNKKKKAYGHLWQGRFYSSILDEVHLLETVRYVERNPVRAKMVKKAWEWKWSSAGEHAGESGSAVKLKESSLLKEIIRDNWKENLTKKEEEKEMEEIRSRTKTGRPIAGEKLLKELEERFKMKLGEKPKGRPKKKE